MFPLIAFERQATQIEFLASRKKKLLRRLWVTSFIDKLFSPHEIKRDD